MPLVSPATYPTPHTNDVVEIKMAQITDLRQENGLVCCRCFNHALFWVDCFSGVAMVFA